MPIHFMSWEDIFGPIGQNLTSAQRGARRRRIDRENADWRTLDKDTNFNGYEYAKGSRFKAFETENFGFVVFERSTSKTPDGKIPGKFIHRF